MADNGETEQHVFLYTGLMCESGIFSYINKLYEKKR